MPDLASARKRVTATQTSMISVHRISTAPGARIFGVIWLPLLSCGGDARGGAPICNCQIQSRRAALISVRIAAPSPSTRSEEHTSELQSLMRISYAVFCLKKQTTQAILCHHTLNKHEHHINESIRQAISTD